MESPPVIRKIRSYTSKVNPIIGFREEKVALIFLIEPVLVLVLMKFMKLSV